MTAATPSLPVEPFTAYLQRRGASATALTAGEVVTATIGLLRGCRSAHRTDEGATWWLTAHGRPVVVSDAGAPDVVSTTADGLDQLAALAPDRATRDLVSRAGEAVATRFPREWEAMERRLFAHADPEPLVLGPLTPRATVEPPVVTPAPLTGGVFDALDTGFLDDVRRSISRLREGWLTSSRIRAAVIGGALAVVLVAAAVALLPGGRGSAPTSAPTATASATTSVVPHPSATSSWPVDERVPLSDDATDVARTLFAQISRCGSDLACRGALEEPSTFRRESLLPDAEHADISLLEDFGGVIVVRVADATRAQYVTLVRFNDRWLVRAVETVADQPS